MEFNKCNQCGNFYLGLEKLCPNCIKKENAQIQQLENYLNNYSTPDSIEELSNNTGIPTKNISKYLNNYENM